ncbi:zinc ribbon domain-containing protein [Rhodobacteraceae bacterium]|nr:zinc ribbon domain-containing protein [Paracoccaceae bacterium]
MIDHRLVLDYHLPPGWMAPFVEGLAQGQTIARRCEDCARTSFPPLRSCPCGASAGAWVELDGTAQIIHRTDGQDGSFALVLFDGAATHSVVRLDNLAPDQNIGRLAKSTGPLPQIILGPELESSHP